MPYGDLDVYVEGALNIKDTSYIGKGSPYCILTVGQQILKSDVVQEGGSKPYWNKTFSFKIDRGMEDLQIRIYSKNTLREDDLLGESLISFAQVFRGGHEVPITSYKVNRSGKHYGEVRLGLVFYAKRRAQPQPQPQPPPGGGGRQQQPLYYRSQGLGMDAESPRYNGLNRDTSFKTISDDDYASSNEGSGRRFTSSHGRNGSIASRFSETSEGLIGAQDSQPANAIREQQEHLEEGPTRAQSLPSAPHHPNNQHQLHGSQSLPPHVAHTPYPQRPQIGQAKQRPVVRPHVEGPLWPPRGMQHDQCNYDDEEDRYNYQDRGVTQDSSISKRDENGILVAVPCRLTSFQDMGSRPDFSFAEESSPSPKQSYSVGMSGANDGIPTAIEVGKLTLVAHDEEEESQVEETATASLAASIVIAEDEARPNNDGVAVGSVTPDDDGPLYKSFRRHGGQATKKLPQVVESPRASQSSKLEGESDEVESQSSHHSRKSSLSQRDRFIPNGQATSDRDVDMESTQYTFGEDLSPNEYVDQVPIHMGPRDLSTTQGSITEGGPQHLQLPMRPPNVSRGGPNLGYSRGGLPQQGNGGPPSMRPLGPRRGVRLEAAMIRPPLEHNRNGMDVDIETTQYTFGEDLSPNEYVDQLPIHMGPRDLSTTQGSITEGGPQHLQLPMRPLNVSRGGPNLGYGRGGLPQQGNGGPPSMRPLGRGRGRGVRLEAAMIRPPLEHNRNGMGVGHQGCAQYPPGNMLPNVMQSAQGPRRRPQQPFVTNQQGFRPMRPQVQNHQPTGPMQMRPGVRPPPKFCESDLQPSQVGKNAADRVLQQATRGVVGVQEAQDTDSDVDSCGSRTSKRSHVSRDSPRSTTSSGLAPVRPPLPLKPKFAIQDASKEDGQRLGKSELQVQVEVEGNGGEQETSSTQPIKFIQGNNVCTIDAPELEEDAKFGSTEFDDPGHLEEKDTPALETLQDEAGADSDEEVVQVQESIPQEQCLHTQMESDVHFTMKETLVVEALHVAPSVTMQGMSSTEQGLDTGVSGESTHLEFEKTLVMEASQVDNAEVALQDLPSIEQNNRPNDDHKHNREVHIEDAHVDFQETKGLKVSNAESFAPQGNLEHEDDTAINEVDIVLPTQEDNYDGTTMATIECEVYAEVVDVDEQAAHGFEFSTSVICNSESHVERQDAQAQKYVNGGCDDSHSDASSHDAKAQQQHKKGRRKKDKAISHNDYRDLSPPKYTPRRSSQVANVHPHYAGAEQNDRVTSWLQESNGDDSMPPPYNTYQDQQGRGRGRGRGRGQVGPRGRGLPPPSNNPQYDEQSYHPFYDFQPTGGGQYYDEPVDEAMAYPQVQYNTQERDMAASVSRPAVVEKELTDGKSKMAKKMKGVMKNLTTFGKATIPILAPIGAAITGEVMKQTCAIITNDGSGQGGDQGYDDKLANMIVNNATNMLLRAAVAPHHQQPVGGGRGGAPMRGQAPMISMPPGQGMSPARGMAPTMRGGMMPLGYGGPRPMAGQPRPQAMRGYPRAPQMGGYPRAPQMGGQPRPPTYYQGEEY